MPRCERIYDFLSRKALILAGFSLVLALGISSLAMYTRTAATQELYKKGALDRDPAAAGLGKRSSFGSLPDAVSSISDQDTSRSPTAMTKIIASDGAANDVFGSPIEISGDTAIIGAAGDDIGGNSNQGSAYIFVRSGNIWIEQQKLMATDGAASDEFGGAVAISGDTVIIGAANHDAGLNNRGAAYVFVRNGTTWAQQAKIMLDGGAINDFFGSSVGITGDTVIVGARGRDFPDDLNDLGAAYVYTRSGTAWTQQQMLAATNWISAGAFGTRMAISNDTAVITGPSGRGAAFVFVRSGNSWAEQAKLTISDAEDNDNLGNGGVAISGDTIIVGHQRDRINGNFETGSAYVFVRTGTAWSEQQKLIADDGLGSDRFGGSLAISGDSVVIGAAGDDIGTRTNQGSAYLFTRCGTVWTQISKITANDPLTNDAFGYSIAMSGDITMIGAQFGDGAVANQGAVYVISPDVGIISTPTGGACTLGFEVNVTSDAADYDLADNRCDSEVSTSGEQCSLRAAIQNANNNTGTDTITFNIPGGGVQTISPATALPDITSKVTINGATQPGYVDKPMIEISGAGSAGDYGLVFASGSSASEVSALTINRFSSAAIKLGSNSNIVKDCFIGLLADGNSVDAKRRQNTGIEVTGAANRIGTVRTPTRASNMITGSEFDQILIRTATAVDNVVAGNDIGLFLNDEPQTMATFNGVTIEDGASNNTVGGGTPEEGNDIGYLFSYGVFLGTDATMNTVKTNLIANNVVGVGVVKASNNTIGGAVGDPSNLTRNAIGGNDVGIFVGDNPNEEDAINISAEVTLETKKQLQKWKRSRRNATQSQGSVLTQNNKIQGNLIGMTRSLADFGNEYGINVRSAENTEIGTGEIGFHNFIGGNIFEGVLLEKESFRTKLRGNFIGVDITGTTIKANRDGVIVAGNENQITNNVISGNNAYGVSVTRNLDTDPIPTGNLIDTNNIGTKGSDTGFAIPNDESGILLDGTGNTISNNVLSGNTRYGLDVRRNSNIIRDNKVGTNRAGDSAVPNGEGGIFVSSSSNTIQANTISGNTGAGLTIVRDTTVSATPPSGNMVFGNFIGTNSAGTSALPNALVGIVLADGVNNNFIGGTAAGTRNIISGNNLDGINIQTGVTTGAVPPFENKIQGNYIGINVDGTAAIPNGRNGISISGATTTLIGGITSVIPAGRNVISGNGANGISLTGGATQNRISGNYIGTKADGATALGNTERGIRVGVSTSGTMIGGPEPNAGNTIAFNGSNGISLTSDAGNNNIIDPNRIFGNVLAGIDIGENGFTPNDPMDADIGPNKLQNYPTMMLSLVGGDLIVSYQVDSAPQHSTYGGTGIYVEFFEADSTGAGRDFLGSDHYLLSDYTNGTPGTRQKNLGNAVALGIVAGDLLTATATDAEGNSSEFAPTVIAPGGAPGFEADVAPRPNGDGNMLSTDITQMRRFVSGLDMPNPATNEAQRIDCAPRSTFGDGIVNSSDVVQGRRYVSGLDVITPAGGPANRGGSVPESIFVPNRDSGVDLFQRELSIGVPEFRRSTVIVPIELTSQGNEVAMSFTLEYDHTVLANPRIKLGKFAPAGSTLTVNTTEPGRIGILIDSSEPMVASALPASILSVTLEAIGIAGQETQLLLTDSTLARAVSDGSADSLSVRYRNGGLRVATKPGF